MINVQAFEATPKTEEAMKVMCPCGGTPGNPCRSIGTFTLPTDHVHCVRSYLAGSPPPHAYIHRGYRFSVIAKLTIGHAEGFRASDQPMCGIDGTRLFTNAPEPELFYLDSLQFANVNSVIGAKVDAFDLSILNPRAQIDHKCTSLSMANHLTMTGVYTGRVPKGLSSGEVFELRLSLEGKTPLVGDREMSMSIMDPPS